MNSTNSPDPYRQESAPIVVGVVGDHGSDTAVRWAARTAARGGRHLRLVHGLDLVTAHAALGTYDVLGPSMTEHLRAGGLEALDAARRLAHEIEPDLPVEVELFDTDPAVLLVTASKSAHMVVLGVSANVGALGHLGSVLYSVTGHGHGTVVVVHDDDMSTGRLAGVLGPVVVGVDGSAASTDAVGVAFAEAEARGVQLIAVHSWSDLRFDRISGHSDTFGGGDADEFGHRILAESLAGWQEKYPGVQVLRKVYPAGPRHHLRQWSEIAQLLVVGSRGRGGFQGLLLGSTSIFLVQRAQCPVMVVHPR